jgi:hypothetical protein
MALVTTMMTTPLLRRLYPGTELEPYIEKSGFWRSDRNWWREATEIEQP